MLIGGKTVSCSVDGASCVGIRYGESVSSV